LSGQSKGTVYAHAYFSASVERTLEADNFGDTCAGLTSVALTAFMVESYLNYLCEKLSDFESRANLFLDNEDDAVIDAEMMKLPNNDLSLLASLAWSLGYKAQADTIIQSLLSTLRKSNRSSFQLDHNAGLSFCELEKKYKLSTKNKLIALLKACETEQSKRDKFIQQFTQLFNARNSLAHGRTENISESYIQEASSDPSKSLPTITASWQDSCSIDKAKEMYSLSKELVLYLNDKFLKERSPLNSLSSQLSSAELEKYQ
jgi:Mor family transcriptional regulator